MILLTLVLNLALLVALAATFQVIEFRWHMSRLTKPCICGVLLGVVGVVDMMASVHLLPGIIFDGRSIILSVGGFFGGPVVALIGALICGAYRLWHGGPGGAMGLSVIVESAGLGVAFYYWRRRATRPVGLARLWAFGLLVHCIMLVLVILLPEGARQVVWLQLGLAIIVLYPLATVLVCLLFLDYEKQRHGQTLIEESEARFRILFEQSPDGILIIDPQTMQFLEFNTAAHQQLGYSRVEFAKLSIGDVEAMETLEKTRETIGHVIRQGRSDFETLQRTRQGEIRNVYVTAQTVDVLGKSVYQCIWRDITEQKREEKERKKLQAQFAQAQKMESVGRLAGGVAHDFNNMLGVILGHSEMALDQLDPTQPLYDDLNEIRKAAERSANLTRQLLAFARKQIAEPKVLDLNETVSRMLNMLRRLIGEDISLDWHPSENLWQVKIDPSQIDQILANLCVNARDAIRGTGNITVETGNNTLDADYCAAHIGFIPGEYVTLTVSDDGCGMEKETLAQIFEPFFTTKDIGKGTGLGLSTVYGIVKQNKGFINAYSETRHGTTFTIYLPRHEGKDGQAAGTVGSAELLMRGHETVLLVEDESAILKLTQRMLEKQGYTVLVASTPGEALRLADEYSDQIHLLMTDVVMPGMNGRDLAKKLMDLYPNLKLLFMSGYTADVIAHNGVLDEGVHFIQKPFSVQSLGTKLRDVLDSV